MKEELRELPEVQIQFIGVGIPQLTAKLVKRTKNKAMYYRWDGVWEVFRVTIAEAAEIEAWGTSFPRREVYPGNEQFGSIAWCYTNEDAANRMYNKL